VGDPILACSYCRTGLYLATSGPLRYRLPPAPERVTATPLVYLPFWRVRGLRYRVLEAAPHVRGSLLDATVPALSALPAGASLGIRPQVAPLSLDTGSDGVAHPDRSVAEAIEAAETSVEGLHAEPPLFTRLVGETASLILAPYALEHRSGDWRLREALKDGVSHPVTTAEAEAIRGALSRDEAAERVTFVPLRCPECGHDLPAAPGSVALLCGQCAKAWWVRGGRLAPVPYAACRARTPGARYLPFWELSFEGQALPASNRAEFRRWVISYQPAPVGWERQPCQVLVPAFKVQPRSFVRLARVFSLAPLDVPETPQLFGEPFASEPVRLPLDEAAQALPVVLAEFWSRRSGSLADIPGLGLRVNRARLVYLPFHAKGSEWVEEATGAAVQAAALEHGARL